MDNVAKLKSGNCKIKPGAISKLGKNIKLKFGRCKNFNYTYITETKVIVYKKGTQVILNEEELEKYFYVY